MNIAEMPKVNCYHVSWKCYQAEYSSAYMDKVERDKFAANLSKLPECSNVKTWTSEVINWSLVNITTKTEGEA